MTEYQLDILLFKIDNEGFDYTFESYSDWSEIEDEEFHKLRKAYLKVRKKLEDHINSMVPCDE